MTKESEKLTSRSHRAHLALGANLGDRLSALRAAVGHLSKLPGSRMEACSAVYETTAVGGPSGQPEYLNAVVRMQTQQSPRALLAACLGIERALGRERLVVKGPRTIDIDLLLYDRLVLDEPDLTVPHPRLHLRRFVLQPLVDLDEQRVHPVLGVTVSDLLRRLPESDRAAVRRVRDVGWAEYTTDLP